MAAAEGEEGDRWSAESEYTERPYTHLAVCTTYVPYERRCTVLTRKALGNVSEGDTEVASFFGGARGRGEGDGVIVMQAAEADFLFFRRFFSFLFRSVCQTLKKDPRP